MANYANVYRKLAPYRERLVKVGMIASGLYELATAEADRDARRDEGRPSHGDLARALLDIALTRYLREGRDDDLLRFMDQVARRLKKVGFEPELTEQVWLKLQDNYAAGHRTLLRQRRTVAELEAQRDGGDSSS